MRDDSACASTICGIGSAVSQVGVGTHGDRHTDTQVAHLGSLPIDFNVGEFIDLVSLGHSHIGLVSYCLASTRSRGLGVGNGDGCVGYCGNSGFCDLDRLFPGMALGIH